MLIRNHLSEPIIVNIRDKSDVVDIDNIEHFSIDGLFIPAKGSARIKVKSPYRKIMYFANVPMTKVGKLQLQFSDRLAGQSREYNTNYGEINSIDDTQAGVIRLDIWDKSSDIAKCNQTGRNDGVDCSDSENIWLKWMLPKHAIFELYNPSTYVLVLLMIGFIIAAAIYVVVMTAWA